MASFARFEDIEAWQKARILSRMIYDLTRSDTFSRDFGLKDQIRRAAVSVMSNIAEGFERDGDSEFRQFLSHAKASAGEVRSQLYVALDADWINQQQFDEAYQLATHAGNLIGALMQYLKRSSLRGRKYN